MEKKVKCVDGDYFKIPSAAIEADLTELGFCEDFNDFSGIDINNTREPGYNFYVYRPFGWEATESDALSINNSILTIKNPVNRAQYDIATAALSSDGKKMVGYAHKGAAYFEASIAFDPDKLPEKGEGFPAFWTMSAEHLFSQAFTKPRYGESSDGFIYLENDFMEWNSLWHDSNKYWHAIHQWTKSTAENNNKQFPAGNCSVVPQEEVDFRRFNTFGCLWIPGERIDTYFNNNLIRSVKISDHPDLVGVGEEHHLPVILGSGNMPLMVDWVRVWN